MISLVAISNKIIEWVQDRLSGRKSGKALHARVIPRAEHPITRKNIPKHALTVLYRLDRNGYDGYLVGGCVRDMLLGVNPKDFDVATNAKPDQVKKLFSNCRLIGRRFRLAHIYFGRDIVEVATYRATAKRKSGKQMTSDSGMILRDNVFGTIDDDAIRRDFTVNALYYRISDFAIVDFCDGMKDIEARTIRMIGEPTQRYREDPVRMLRAARFAAKLDFTIEPETAKPIPKLSNLLGEVPSARLFEEALKLFLSGHAQKSLDHLRSLNLIEHLFEVSKDYQDKDWAFIIQGLQATDHRIQSNQTTSPGFIFALLLWPGFVQYHDALEDSKMPPVARKHKAIDKLFAKTCQRMAIPKRISIVSRGVWELQHRLENVKKHQVHRLLGHPYFRAAYDFLVLRSETQHPELQQTANWWTLAQNADDEQLASMCEQLPKQQKRRRKRKKRKADEA